MRGDGEGTEDRDWTRLVTEHVEKNGTKRSFLKGNCRRLMSVRSCGSEMESSILHTHECFAVNASL